jgi:hypothetical protein
MVHGILRPVDGVALASVITSGAAVIATSGVAVWTTRQSAKLARESARESANRAREQRVQQRLAESYLEVLRVVQREGQWVQATLKNWQTTAMEADWLVSPEDQGKYMWERVVVPERAVTDRAIIAAHLTAFGSDNVRGLYEVWRSTIAKIDIGDMVLRALTNESYGSGVGPLKDLDTLKDLDEKLGPDELAARQALADAIAEELGHR